MFPSSSFIGSAIRHLALHFQLNELKKQPTQKNDLSISQINQTNVSPTYSNNSLCCEQTSHNQHTSPYNKTGVKPEGNKHHKVFSFFMLPRTKVNPCVVGAFDIDRESEPSLLCQNLCVFVCEATFCRSEPTGYIVKKNQDSHDPPFLCFLFSLRLLFPVVSSGL